MQRVLSIDPGHTTGIAAFDEAGTLKFSMTVSKESVYENGFMESLTKMAKPDIVLIECLPSQVVDKQTQLIWFHFNQWYRVAGYTVLDILPAQWKGLVARVEIPGQHARDAATMGRWYLRAKGL